ncbi:NADH-dependent flavin oxidoreductase [Lithohypha guttulata]|uniref:NADH-dependent flavin oxidoreductase n=1 Tax=Lithohypha guttulata TaxID=1690604 RepID=UPI002DDE8861|nr:NADH-dependent flavin oxidoreductase [Lithohypha guttulata]
MAPSKVSTPSSKHSLPLHSAASAHHDQATKARPNLNPPVPDIPFFTPQHRVSPGAVFGNVENVPTLFQPLTIRGRTLKNRIVVAPMCQYSVAPDGPQAGCLTPYHIATLGHYALKGAALTFCEAMAVQPNGRISPNDAGLWCDAQIDGLKQVADFVHSQGGLLGVQLAHAGRKASQTAPWIGGGPDGRRKNGMRATRDVGGWGPGDVVGPTGGHEMVWDGKSENDPDGGFWAPRGLTIEEIDEMVEDWKSAAIRAVRAGVDVIEIHGAHGYLIHQFLSPVTNRRTDQYGGDFEGRTLLVRRIIEAVRSVMPISMPLFLRVSATEWLEDSEFEKAAGGSWNVDATEKLAKILPDLGVDLLDVSSGGNHRAQNTASFRIKDYQTRNAGRIRKALKAERKHMYIGAVGLITDAEQARDLVQEDGHAQQYLQESTLADEAKAVKEMTDAHNGKEAQADVVFIARQFMREPEWVLRTAQHLGVDVAWPSQFLRVRFPKL